MAVWTGTQKVDELLKRKSDPAGEKAPLHCLEPFDVRAREKPSLYTNILNLFGLRPVGDGNTDELINAPRTSLSDALHLEYPPIGGSQHPLR